MSDQSEHEAKVRMAAENDQLAQAIKEEMKVLFKGRGYNVYTDPTVMIDREKNLAHVRVITTKTIKLSEVKKKAR